MELAVPYKPSAGVLVSGMPPGPPHPPNDELTSFQHPGQVITSSYHIWDWHSYIIMFLVMFILYHLWAFRVLYLRFLQELTRSFRNRVFNAEMRVNLEIRTDHGSDTTAVVLSGFAEPETELEAGTIEIHEILEADDHFHDCLESP